VTPAVPQQPDSGQTPRPLPPAPSQRPTIAVALKHEPGELPTVLASGRGALAERILEIAFQTGIKVREDADLAQLLSAVQANSPIPIGCFEAVAEILNYLYRANQAAGAAGANQAAGAAGAYPAADGAAQPA
jgi:flagellar biosynthesis protein